MTREELKKHCEKEIEMCEFWAYGKGEELNNNKVYQEHKLILELLEQEQKTWSLDDAREDFVYDVYNTLDFLPTNEEANRIIDSFDRVTSGLKLEQESYNASEWCHDCSEFNHDKHCCPRYNKVIRNAVKETKEPKVGHWIYGENEYGIDGYHCDICGFFVPWDYAHKFINYIKDYKFCPKCSAKMIEPQESEG